MRPTHLVTFALVLATSTVTVPVARAERDHLEGYKVKDLNAVVPPGSYTLGTQFGNATCVLKKAKFYLVQAEKNLGNDPSHGLAGHFVCYRAKCSGGVPTSETAVDDQFGNHSLKAKKTQLVCVPSPQPCEATTGGFCWFAGGLGESCDTVCANAGRTYDAATASYAGSSGTDVNCQNVLNDLGLSAAFFGGQSCGAGVGCSVDEDSLAAARCLEPTTSSASIAFVVRACACQ